MGKHQEHPRMHLPDAVFAKMLVDVWLHLDAMFWDPSGIPRNDRH